MTPTRRAALGLFAAAPFAADAASAAGGYILLGSTTTTENSGLLAYLAPLFEAETGVAIRTVVAGTGKILKLAERGDLFRSHWPHAHCGRHADPSCSNVV